MQNLARQIGCIMGNVESANNTNDNFLRDPEKVLNFKFDRNCENGGKFYFMKFEIYFLSVSRAPISNFLWCYYS